MKILLSRFPAFLPLLCLVIAAVNPPESAAENGNLRLKTVVIDAGHGGKDPGCVSRDRKVYEKNITLDIAKRLGTKIKETYPDVKVIYTRSTDVYVTLNGRAEIANRNNANLFISIHVNAASSTQANGFSAHILGNSGSRDLFSSNMDVCKRENSVILLEEDYSTNYQGFDPNDPESFIFFNLMQNAYYEQSLLYAAEVNDELAKGPITRSRGISQDPFLVLWKTTMPSVLVEVGFMSNASDLKILNTSTGRGQIASRLFDAFSTFKKKYDGSLKFSSDAADNEVSVTPAGSPGYGVQIFALSKKLSPGDPAFKGYRATAVYSGGVYKYIVESDSEKSAESLHQKLKKHFPGSFPVKVDGQKVSRL